MIMNAKLLLILILALAGCGKSGLDVSHGTNAPAKKQALYHCPMHPTYTSDKPGDCPICGMKLVPVGENHADASGASLPGRVSIVLSAEKRQLIGLTTSPVERRNLMKNLR